MAMSATPNPAHQNTIQQSDTSDQLSSDPHAEHINAQLEEFRKQLLGMTLSNHLLNCPHGPSVNTQIRVVDELPDAVFERLEKGDLYSFLPLPLPRDEPDDEDSEDFQEALESYKKSSALWLAASAGLSAQRSNDAVLTKVERDVRDIVRARLGLAEWESEHGLSPEDLAYRRGINPSYDLPSSGQVETADRHHDNGLQTLLDDGVLTARLGLLRDRSRSSISQSGVGTLFAAFGFLEWFESDASNQPHLAPLILIPTEIVRDLHGGKYHYGFRGLGDESAEKATSNVTLAMHLRQQFGLELPTLRHDDSPESYFARVDAEICAHHNRWRVRRFLTIRLFTYSKLAIYVDLDPAVWPEGQQLAGHRNIRTLMAQAGVSDVPYAENRAIDEDEAAAANPFLIYDADSSQHSAIADVLAGKDLTIYGPPGTGKSQTIANTIAAAAMAGKTVLFVAEKLTALDVVRDRLAKAGLGDFCFNLHAQGLKSGEVKRSLADRLSMPPPNFDRPQYEQQKQHWTKQRDALRTYASVMGERIGHLEETVHDILWQAIARQRSDSELPPAIAALQLSRMETVTAGEIRETRGSIKGLQRADGELLRLISAKESSPWRGMRRADLAPMEVGPALHLLGTWQHCLTQLEDTSRRHGLTSNILTLDELADMMRALEILEQHPDATKSCDLASLALQDTRRYVSGATDRSRHLQQLTDKLFHRFAISGERLPDADDVRALAENAATLAVTDLTVAAIVNQAKELRDHAVARASLDAAVEGLKTLLELSAENHGADDVIELASELLGEAPVELLSLRIESLATRDAARIVERAAAEVEELNAVRADLETRFDLESLPAVDELRSAARVLNAAGGPLLFNKPAKRAMALHKGLSLVKTKPSPRETAGNFRQLAHYKERWNRLEDDTEIARCLGPHWRGPQSDLSPAQRVVEWSARVLDSFVGTGTDGASAQRTLLSGKTDQLAEFRKLAATLPADWRAIRAGLDANGASVRADRLDELADRSESMGLEPSLPLAQAADLADLIQEYRSLTAAADSDETLADVFPFQRPSLQALESVEALAIAMSDAGRSDAGWQQAVGLFTRSANSARTRQELGDQIRSVEVAWSECAETLQFDEEAFFDGERLHEVSLSKLLERAQSCCGARETLLPWSTYQRAWAAVAQGHASAILAAFDENDVPLSLLDDAYEWALYRSLATIAYRRYPQLNALASWQLSDHQGTFRQLEDRLQELERNRIAHELHSRPVDHGVSFGGPAAFTEKALIQNQVARQSKGLGIKMRELIQRAGTALRQLKPCFMMSPTSVAELLPRDAELFDIVIIDEASQMLPCDALGAIARGKQTAIVGDPKQLPPSTFFQGGGVSDAGLDDDDGNPLAPAMESILDLSLSAWQPPRYLQWHYRSRHSSLIQFSNARFYNNRLIVFPGADERRHGSGVRYHHVADGLYQSGLNTVEADHVVRAACEFMANPSNHDLNLAIVAMNQRQRDRIRERLDEETARQPLVARYRRRWRNTLYPFIVRNLETVQGDERDVIFISTVYGRERPGGAVMRRFGPITHAGGERRLNVLFSRARERMEVFSSMRANDIGVTPGISEGVRVLRDYLEYAATGRIEVGIPSARLVESPFEEYVLARLQSEGLEVDPQVGVASYRIDLGIRHPDYPHGYLLGVECDGRSYHSAPSVRDRDRLREAVLRDLGWDIYRIWSTDWFKDPDEEMRKLMAYVETSIEAWRADSRSENEAPGLPGKVVELPGNTFADSAPMPTGDQADEEPIFVEVGDTVTYRDADPDGNVQRATIVQGTDNPANGIISDDKPLAIALLGAENGETVTVGRAPAEFTILVVGIERPGPERGDQSKLVGDATTLGVELERYREWRGDAPDPRSAKRDRVAQTLLTIVEAEAPVVVERAFQAYIRGCGVQRLSPQIRRTLNRALASLERRERVTVQRATNKTGYQNALILTDAEEACVVRELGPRAFDEVPLPELRALLNMVRASAPGASSAEHYRQVLNMYGLIRMTAQIRNRFEEADQYVTREGT